MRDLLKVEDESCTQASPLGGDVALSVASVPATLLCATGLQYLKEEETTADLVGSLLDPKLPV